MENFQEEEASQATTFTNPKKKKKKKSSNHDLNLSNENPNVTSTTASMSSSCARSMVGFCVEFQSRQTVRFLSSNWCKGLKNRPKIWRLWSIFSKLCNSKAFCIRRMLKTKWATRTSFMIRTVSLQPSWWSQQGLRRAALVTVEMNCRLRASDRGLVLAEIQSRCRRWWVQGAIDRFLYKVPAPTNNVNVQLQKVWGPVY